MAKVTRSKVELARAATARDLVRKGKLDPLDALDLITQPTTELRQAEAKVRPATYYTRVQRDQ